MRKLFIIILAISLCSFTIPKHIGFVNDYAKLMDSTDISYFESCLRNYEKTTTNEISIVTLTDMNGDNIENVAYDIFHTWGIGKKGVNNGVLMILSIKERKFRIQTGYGVEEYLTDSKCKMIQENYMKEDFKSGNYYSGFFKGFQQIKLILNKGNFKEQYKEQTIKEQEKPYDWSYFFTILVIIFIIALIIISITFLLKRKRKIKTLKSSIRKYTQEFGFILNKNSLSNIYIEQLENILTKILEVKNLKDEILSVKFANISKDFLFYDIITTEIKNAKIHISNINLNNITESDDLNDLNKKFNIIKSNEDKIYNMISNSIKIKDFLKNKQNNIDKLTTAYEIHFNLYEKLHKIPEFNFIKLYSNSEIDSVIFLYETLENYVSGKNYSKSIIEYNSINNIINKTLSKFNEIVMVDEGYKFNIKYYDENYLGLDIKFKDVAKLKGELNSENLKIFDNIKTKYQEFKNTTKTSKYSLGKDLKEILDFIRILKDKHKTYIEDIERRKIREEDEREEQIRSSYSSSISYSSSDSGFSFGGGDSGGGGSTSSF